METYEAISLMPALYFGAFVVGLIGRGILWGVRYIFKLL